MDERAKEGWKTAAKTVSWLGEVAAKRKDGSNVEIQVVVTVVRDNDGKPIAIMGLHWTSRTENEPNKRFVKARESTVPSSRNPEMQSS